MTMLLLYIQLICYSCKLYCGYHNQRTHMLYFCYTWIVYSFDNLYMFDERLLTYDSLHSVVMQSRMTLLSCYHQSLFYLLFRTVCATWCLSYISNTKFPVKYGPKLVKASCVNNGIRIFTIIDKILSTF